MSATPLRPVVLMVASSGVLTINDAIIKWLSQGYPVGEVITVRGALLVALMLVWATTTGRLASLRVRSWRLQGTRGVLMAGSTYLFVTALSLMPIADAVAIAFAGPIIATAPAAALPDDKVAPWQIDGITGATITSEAIGNILNDAASAWVPALERDADGFAGRSPTEESE